MVESNYFKKLSVLLFCALLGSFSMPYASANNESQLAVEQTGSVKGVVTDASGPIIGAVVKVKDTSNGTLTDIDGVFALSNVPKGAIIEVAYIGYEAVSIEYTGQQEIRIEMKEESQMLSEVVVTALGIKREKRAIGYSMQEMKGDEIVQARESNIANALSGKISGLQITRSGNGPGASSKITLRGNNSITGLNQPLIVVDGVPMENFTGAANNDFWNPSADMGNGISDINSDDIASMSVLKGASAAALYGARAGNGVILITTKSGRKTEGLGITISSSVSAETVFMSPKRQNSFGQGSLGVYDKDSGASWGPLIEGQTYEKWDGSESKMRSFNNVNNYFKTGVNLTETFSFSQQYKTTAIYSSLSRMDDRSKIPGSKLSRTSMTTRATSNFGKDERWTLDTKIQYIKSKADNRPISGKNDSNSFLAMYLLPRSMDIRDFKAAVRPDNTMLWFGTSQQINPYWLENHRVNSDTRDRFLVNGSLKYQFTSWLNAELRAGSDMYYTDYDNKTYWGSSMVNRYSIQQERFFENNFSFLVTAQKDNIIGRWGGNLALGGNLMHRRHKSMSTGVELVVPDLFSINNSKNKPDVEQRYSEKKINSIYGTGQVNYDGWAFLDLTFRNDWSSTMSKKNRSFFYPSVSTSWVISDMLEKIDKPLPSWFTYAKVRASFAEVGNDLDPYQLYNTYYIGQAPDGSTTANQNEILYNEDVRSELIKSWEVGTELRFLQNRLGFDFSWYKTNATRQLLNIPMDGLSGFKSRKINAGNIENKGIELMVNARPIQTASGFNWDIMVNFSKNKNRIIELYKSPEEEISLYTLGGYDNLQVYARAGGNYGEIWGTRLKRVEDKNSPHYGKLITENGLPTSSTEKEKIGDQQAKALMGITNTFTYKGWSLSFLIDARFGGDIFSGTLQMMEQSGTSNKTVVNGQRPNMVIDGVYVDESGAYQPNTTEITTQQYWETVTSRGNLGVGEVNMYSATNVRLRNLALNYAFSKSLLKNTPFTQVKLGVSCNNVWMLKSKMNGIDPESIYATSTNATGFEFGSSPTSRTYLFNVTLGF